MLCVGFGGIADAGAPSRQPVLATDFPDPAILRVGSTYYAYSTSSLYGNVPYAVSTDLRSWSLLGDAVPLETFPTWAAPGSSTWAPGVVALDGEVLLFVSVPTKDTGRNCIAVLTAPTPAGPFTDATGGPLWCGRPEANGAIDPFPYRTSDGRLYLYTKDVASSHQLWVHELAPDGRSILSTTFLLGSDLAWENHGIENPQLVRAADAWWLIYSANWWTDGRYSLGAARCDTPLGPCQKVHTDGPWLSKADGYNGPGGEAIVPGPDGELWMVFHAWQAGKASKAAGGARYLYAAPIGFDGDGPHFGSPPPRGKAVVLREPGGVVVGGGAADPSTKAAVPVDLVVDGKVVASTRTAKGLFVAKAALGDGTHQACAIGRNNAPGDDTTLGCADLTISPDPVGQLELLVVPRQAPTLAGWVLDPDTKAPVTVEVTVDGTAVGSWPAARPGRELPGYSADYTTAHHLQVALPELAGHAGTVCASALDTTRPVSVTLGCWRYVPDEGVTPVPAPTAGG